MHAVTSYSGRIRAPKAGVPRATQTGAVSTGNRSLSIPVLALLGIFAAADAGRPGDVAPSIALIDCSSDLVFETIPWSADEGGTDTAVVRGRVIDFDWNPGTGELSFDVDTPAFKLPEDFATTASVATTLRCE